MEILAPPPSGEWTPASVVTSPAPTETPPAASTETPPETPPASTEPPPAVPDPIVPDFSTLTGGKYKDISEVEALETRLQDAERIRQETEAKYNRPELQNWLEMVSNPDRVSELAPIIADLSINYKEMDPIALIRKGWDEEYSQFVPAHRAKQDVFEEYLNATFSVTDPNDRENGFGATGTGETNLLAKADSYRQKFESRQEANRTLAKEALQATAPPPVNQAPVMSDEQKEAQIKANLAAFNSFKPALEGVSEIASPFLELAPQTEWLTSRAKELSENPFAILNRYFPVDENGIVQPNVSQILNDMWLLDNASSLINGLTEKTIAHGRADGTTKIVERLQNPTPTPGLAQTRPTTQWKSPTGAPPPGQ